MADDVMLLCECHEHISIAEDPIVAARLFDEIGSDRLGAIVHTHEPAEHLRRRFDAYGERISHVHVNYLDMSSLSVPSLSQRVDDWTVGVGADEARAPDLTLAKDAGVQQPLGLAVHRGVGEVDPLCQIGEAELVAGEQQFGQ